MQCNVTLCLMYYIIYAKEDNYGIKHEKQSKEEKKKK